MTELLLRASRQLRGLLPSAHEPSWEDELAMAAQYDAERGYDQPRAERSKLGYELAEGTPQLRWTPPSRRAAR